MARPEPPARRICPSCRVGIIKTAEGKVCAKCHRAKYKAVAHKIIEFRKQRRIGEPSQEMPGL